MNDKEEKSGKDDKFKNDRVRLSIKKQRGSR